MGSIPAGGANHPAVHPRGGLRDDFIFTANPPPRAKRNGMGFASCELAHGELVHRGMLIINTVKRTAWSRAFRCYMGFFDEKTAILRLKGNRNFSAARKQEFLGRGDCVLSPCISVFSRRARRSPRGRGRGFRDAGRGGCAQHSPRCIRPPAKSGERVRRGSARGRAGRSL